jgi:hemin uptake protein HemP
MPNHDPEPDSNEKTPPEEAPPKFEAAKLFGNRREIIIVLEGVAYRLRITRRGRLILQK